MLSSTLVGSANHLETRTGHPHDLVLLGILRHNAHVGTIVDHTHLSRQSSAVVARTVSLHKQMLHSAVCIARTGVQGWGFLVVKFYIHQSPTQSSPGPWSNREPRQISWWLDARHDISSAKFLRHDCSREQEREGASEVSECRPSSRRVRVVHSAFRA